MFKKSWNFELFLLIRVQFQVWIKPYYVRFVIWYDNPEISFTEMRRLNLILKTFFKQKNITPCFKWIIRIYGCHRCERTEKIKCKICKNFNGGFIQFLQIKCRCLQPCMLDFWSWKFKHNIIPRYEKDFPKQIFDLLNF